MSSESALAVQRLRTQIERQGTRTERQCAKCLKSIPQVLLPNIDITVTYVDQEQRLSTGTVDLILVVDAVRLGKHVRREAFIWELKAPQLHLFQVETKDRACPTPDLHQAENQLLHYHDEVAKNSLLLKRWAMFADDVHFGGIVIGRDATVIKSKSKPESSLTSPEMQLARQAFDIRERFFYKTNNIQLWTWDKVLTIAETPIITNQRFGGDSPVPMDLKSIIDPPIALRVSK